MNFNEYQKLTYELALPQCKTKEYMVLGLANEAGEVAGVMKKLLRDNTPEVKQIMKKELGDVFWYLAGTASEFGLSLEEVAEENIRKLHDRRDRGVLQGSGDNR